MGSGTNYLQEYGQAEQAYREGNFTQAAKIIDRLAEEFADNPSVLLLRGHIYCSGFQDYELAEEQYQAVLGLSSEDEIVECAYNAIEQVRQLQQQSNDIGQFEDEMKWNDSDDEFSDLESNSYSFELDQYNNEIAEDDDFNSPFSDSSLDNSHHDEDSFSEFDNDNEYSTENPFAEIDSSESEYISQSESLDLDHQNNFNSASESIRFVAASENNDETNYSQANSLEEMSHAQEEVNHLEEEDDDEFDYELDIDNEEDYENNFIASSEIEIDTVLTEPHAIDNSEGFNFGESSENNGLDYQDELEFDEIDSSFFDLEELEQGLPDTGLFNIADDSNEVGSEIPVSQSVDDSSIVEADEEFVAEGIDSGVLNSEPEVEPVVEVSQGFLGSFFNATMPKKQLITACCTGVISAIAVFGVGVGSTLLFTSEEEKPSINLVSTGLMSLAAGVASFGTTIFFGSIIAKQVNQATRNLQHQFDDVYQGNLNAKATIYSQDEFGRLATGFNRMTRVILTTTQEAQRRAEETEQAKEDLQRQVIRLLDDVEGAARGDLTVQATVTADVLGAVADAFNLTIQSLREIGRQVKEAAEQVNKSSTDSEHFARNQSSEALKMAEELAVTLNSVQMMTESIERVADNAREAEEVARSSSVTALKGGKAVESTVAGIFQIRETVSDTARKVKRLAEASQEISKIVLLISQIAERTNQLALNASIQAAKAGEAGRGFAVVADEVRQLADRSGKSLKEIEQIVLQIQSETGSVMTAMEEGIQEVIDVTSRAEQAKTALEDIIQVSNRIDTLVRSITADTVEQRENSRAVAQVMQSVELTAQATSQESQRVAGSLQSLVSIARDLLSSVERFRIDKQE